jgi:hypothetical protein
MAESSLRNRKEELPHGWCRPTATRQLTLFPRPADEALRALRVSRGDLRRWREVGWISFDVDTAAQMHDPELFEIEFVRNIARSALSISQINEFLTDLPKPFSYDPEYTSYHFAHGWVMPLPEEPFTVVDREVEAWIDYLATSGETDRLRRLSEQITEALGSAESASEKKM